MPFVTPEEINRKSVSTYSRFLKCWVCGESDDFFPLRLRVNLILDKQNPQQAISATQRLVGNSKSERGYGYTVHREHVKTRGFGKNAVPKSVTIDTLDDLLRLAETVHEFSTTESTVQRVRHAFPQLAHWVVANVNTLWKLNEDTTGTFPTSDTLDGLIAVTRHFIEHPWPDCYTRQIPVSVDTKFISRHTPTLRQWLDILLPDSAIDINETKFERRFGLRDGRPHRAVRLLDPTLQAELELPFDELSLPLPMIAKLPVVNATAIIVENDLNLLTLPSHRRTIAIRGEGNAVNRLEEIGWLQDNRLIYWGDIDTDGFLILSRLRNLHSHVDSIMMDVQTLDAHSEYIIAGNGKQAPRPTNLTSAEATAFSRCHENNERLEQEKILQSHVEIALHGIG